VTLTGKAAVLAEKPVHASCTMWADLQSNPGMLVTVPDMMQFICLSVSLSLCYTCSTAQSTSLNNYE